LHSHQFRHSRSTAVVTVAEVEAAEELPMEAAEASIPAVVVAFIPAVVVAVSMEAVDFLAVAQAEFMAVAAAPLAARDRSVVEVISGATGLNRAAIPGRSQITPRPFVPPSMTVNGIPSATLEAHV
jgi:hypothetical protein